MSEAYRLIVKMEACEGEADASGESVQQPNPVGIYTFDSSGLSSPMRGSLTWHVLSLSHIQFASPRTLRSLKQDQAHRGPPSTH